MDLRDLHAFRLVAEAGSITAAAETLGTVQSALSSRLRRLEENIGEPLFERLPRGVRLTAAGHRLLPFVHRLEQISAEALAATRNCSSILEGHFRVGAIEIAAATILPPVIGQLLGKVPAINLRLRVGVTRNLGEAVSRDELDAAIVAGRRPVDEGLVLRPLTHIPLVLIRPAGRSLKTLEQAFVFADGCICRAKLESLLLRQRLEFRLVEIGSVEAMVGCVAAGAGVALVPATLATTPAFERDRAGTLDLWLVYRREAQAKANLLTQCFREALSSAGNTV